MTMRYKSILLWLLVLASLFIGCKNNDVKINGVYSDEELKNWLGAPEYEKMIVLKTDTSINLYEYQNGLYQFIPDKDSLIVLEQGYKNGSKKKILWLTEYEQKKKVLDVLDYNTKTTHF